VCRFLRRIVWIIGVQAVRRFPVVGDAVMIGVCGSSAALDDGEAAGVGLGIDNAFDAGFAAHGMGGAVDDVAAGAKVDGIGTGDSGANMSDDGFVGILRGIGFDVGFEERFIHFDAGKACACAGAAVGFRAEERAAVFPVVFVEFWMAFHHVAGHVVALE